MTFNGSIRGIDENNYTIWFFINIYMYFISNWWNELRVLNNGTDVCCLLTCNIWRQLTMVRQTYTVITAALQLTMLTVLVHTDSLEHIARLVSRKLILNNVWMRHAWWTNHDITYVQNLRLEEKLLLHLYIYISLIYII